MFLIDKRILVLLFTLIFLQVGWGGSSIHATSEVDMSRALTYIKKAVEAQDLDSASQSFQLFKQEWFRLDSKIKQESSPIHAKIQSRIADVSLDLLADERKAASSSLQELQQILLNYQNGKLNKNGDSTEKISVTSYIKLLEETSRSIENKQLNMAEEQIEELRTNWLEIEGDIVSKSQQVYTNSERNLVLLEGYLKQGETEEILQTVNQMKADLTPFRNSAYGMWDAALIPIREGLEALLVIGALLAFTKKRKETKGTYWIWGGTTLGILVSIAIGFSVSYWLNASSFGANNFIINGTTGIFASLMLLYVSYWLHRHSNVKRWNSYIKARTEKTLGNGKMFSFAILAFLAILREGLETVIFLIGMANRMPVTDLILGIAVGFGILTILGIIILTIGKKLPLKPFFIVSSLIVLYMSIKFMGSGIHSLQLAGYLPSTINEMIPTVSFLGIYPSWSSTLPQLIIIILAITVLLLRQFKLRRNF